MFKRMISITAVMVLLNSTGAAEQKAATPDRKDERQTVVKTPAEQVKTERIAELNRRKMELIRQIHATRKDLLKNNPKLRRMHQQLLKQARELALELNANREMSKLNDSLSEVESMLKKEQAPAPEKKPDPKQK